MLHRCILPLAVYFVSACAGHSNTRSAQTPSEEIIVDVPWQSDGTGGNQSIHEAAGQPPARPTLTTTTYHLTWQGKRIGEAREVFHRSETNVRILRHESIRIKRGGTPVRTDLEVVVETDPSLSPTRVELKATAGSVSRTGHAVRADNGQWVIALGGEPVRMAPGNAVPIELVPYLLAQSGEATFAGDVLLAGYGFAVVPMKLHQDGKKGTAVLATQWGDITTQLHMKRDGSLDKATTHMAESRWVPASRLDEPFTPMELADASTIPLRGKGPVLTIQNTRRRPPVAIAGQQVALLKDGWQITFEPATTKMSAQVARIAKEVDRLLVDSHDAPGALASDALSLGKGDCTAHATLFVDMAANEGIEAKVVTGFRINDHALVRHRWAVVHSEKGWIAVDPTRGDEEVEPGTHLALAVHGPSAADLALVDQAVFQGLDSATARWTTK